MDKVFVTLGAEELYTAAILKNSKDFKLYNNRAQARINMNKVSTNFWKKVKVLCLIYFHEWNLCYNI